MRIFSVRTVVHRAVARLLGVRATPGVDLATRLRGAVRPRRLAHAVEQALHHHKEQRDKENAEEGAAQHATEYAGADRMLSTRAGAGRQGEREHAETKRHGRHQDWTQAVTHGMQGR